MHKSKYIESLQNPLIKKLVLLKEKHRGRKKSGLFVLEGTREFQMALNSGYKMYTVLFYSGIVEENRVLQYLDGLAHLPDLVEVSKEVYQRIAYREKTEGIVAIAESKIHGLEELKFENKNPLILIAESPEKPGNLGAMLRTADAAKLDAVILADPKGDLYNPNVIRSSVGCIFTVQIGMASSKEVIRYLKEKKIGIYAAALSASIPYHQVDFTGPSAIAVGTESTGLTATWLQNADQNIIIPMQGEIDSMNVSVSAAIIIFEAKRQRAFK
ncbi:TrmH family RNA methyltransferase [Poritiphilus flavus]|uniref:RNA methyltransferase n=1 Tax=Poritiphilus flavus TaxID=2697053 RepID=A0A6L9EA11_9FLAO|nr:RNA methyltransferase [Poritiphilus flavus]NAS11378.1 RNA methyltransferase [Poritiphilus flavus]